MPISLDKTDFRPLAEFKFQHWHRRRGLPFDLVRPLTPTAAERAWARALELSQSAWADDADGRMQFDLRQDGWSPETVTNWLLDRVPHPERPVLVCFQPQAAVVVPWGTLCRHWLTLLWTGGCAWCLQEQWVLVHNEDVLALGVPQR